jgi:hypothetical protein
MFALRQQQTALWLVLFIAVCLNVSSWFYARHTREAWINVPPVPTVLAAKGMGFGDAQFAFRAIGIMLQNLGDTGGRDTPLERYDFTALSQWFFLENTLDPKSNYIPALAGYYFGSVQDPQKLYPIIDYLRAIGASTEGDKWRWLAHGVFLARFEMKDMDLALDLAKQLAAHPTPGLPHWARQMPVFVLNAQGNKEEALGMMIEMLKAGEGKMTVQEINFTKDYICTRILDEAEAARHPLCQDTP